jgi:plasmid maintenance system antidote protein VapI
MIEYLPILKGIHPGFILERELKLRKIPKNKFALLLNEHTQTIVSITKARRKMNTALAIKIEKLLGLEEGTLMVLQAYYDIEQEKKKQQTNTPDLSKIRSVLFWDTNMASINWEKQKNAVIKRVFERGNEYEKDEISRFYGPNTVNEVITSYGK